MSEDRIEGSVRQGVGRMEDAIGGLTGDAGRQAKGKYDQAAGSVQDAMGQAKDRAADFYSEVESYAKDEPLLALSIALALGLVIGFTLRGGRKTVYVRK